MRAGEFRGQRGTGHGNVNNGDITDIICCYYCVDKIRDVGPYLDIGAVREERLLIIKLFVDKQIGSHLEYQIDAGGQF